MTTTSSNSGNFGAGHVSITAPVLTSTVGPDSFTYRTYTDAQGVTHPVPAHGIPNDPTWTENTHPAAQAFRDSFARYTTVVDGQTVEHTDTQAAVTYLIAQLTDHAACLEEVRANLDELSTMTVMQKQVIAEQRDEIARLQAELAKRPAPPF